MWDMIHAFGAGIAFALGVFSGAVLCQMANRKAREEFVNDVKAEREAMHERLTDPVAAITRVAIASEQLVTNKRDQQL